MSGTRSTPAGWYDDPDMVNTRRYWDGEKWTDNLIEKSSVPSGAPSTASARAATPAPEYSPWVGVGYLVAFFLPVAGLIYGLVWYLTWSKHWGVRIMGWSAVFLLAWILLVALGIAHPYGL